MKRRRNPEPRLLAIGKFFVGFALLEFTFQWIVDGIEPLRQVPWLYSVFLRGLAVAAVVSVIELFKWSCRVETPRP